MCTRTLKVLLCSIVMALPVQADSLFEKSAEHLSLGEEITSWVTLQPIACPYEYWEYVSCLLINGPGGYVIVPLQEHYI